MRQENVLDNNNKNSILIFRYIYTKGTFGVSRNKNFIVIVQNIVKALNHKARTVDVFLVLKMGVDLDD